MKFFNNTPEHKAAAAYIAADTGSTTLKAKMSNLLKLHSLNEAQHYQLQTLLRRAGVSVGGEK